VRREESWQVLVGVAVGLEVPEVAGFSGSWVRVISGVCEVTF
jgi:hypothetical protein